MPRATSFVYSFTFLLSLSFCGSGLGAHLPFKRGDTNRDGRCDIGDAICGLDYLFGSQLSECKRGVAACSDAADANDDGKVDIADCVAILDYLFGGGGPLPEPFEACGNDPTLDGLTCEEFKPCQGTPSELDQAVALLVSDVLQRPGAPAGSIVYIVKKPLQGGTEVTPYEEESAEAITLPESLFFAYVDDAPEALFAHPVRYVLIDTKTGTATVYHREWWPLVNGEDLWSLENNGDIGLIRIYHVRTSSPFRDLPWKAGFFKGAAPRGDYGDAPDGVEAYYGVEGKFPTFYATLHSRYGNPGAHVLYPGEEMLGQTVSVEVDAEDPSDPDGVFNHVDGDLDDGAFAVLEVTPSSATVRFYVQVTVTASAPDLPSGRFLNVLADLNRDGEWQSTGALKEWVVVNKRVDVPPGSTQWIELEGFHIPLVDRYFNSPIWIRVLLTREALDPSRYTLGGWDGSGQWEYGEVEDWYLSFRPWVGEEELPAPTQPPPVEPPKIDPKVCNEFCQNLLLPVPCQYYALVISGGDHPGQKFVAEAAQSMKTMFEKLYGNSQVSSVTDGTAADIDSAIQALAAKVSCYDRVAIYIVAHGSKSGWIRIMKGHGKISTNRLAEMLRSIGICPSPQNFFLGECLTPQTSCSTTIILESCHSGNFFTPLQRTGRNVMTSSTAAQLSWSASSGRGSEFTNRIIEAIDSGNGDADGDGEVTWQEAFAYAQGRMKTPKPQTPLMKSQANCNCICNLWQGWRDDPPADLIEWREGMPLDEPPQPWEFLDVQGYGGELFPPEPPVPEILSISILFWTELIPPQPPYPVRYILKIDRDGEDANNDMESLLFADSDLCYIASGEERLGWVLLKSRFNAETGTWEDPIPASSKLQIEGNRLTFLIDPAEENLPGGRAIEFKVVTVGAWEDIIFGDDTDWDTFFLP